MNRYDREPWVRPEIENTDEEPTPELEARARARFGREVVARTPFGIITGPGLPENGFLRIKRKPEQENKERNDE